MAVGTLKIEPAFNYKDPNGSTSVTGKALKVKLALTRITKTAIQCQHPGLDVSDKSTTPVASQWWSSRRVAILIARIW